MALTGYTTASVITAFPASRACMLFVVDDKVPDDRRLTELSGCCSRTIEELEYHAYSSHRSMLMCAGWSQLNVTTNPSYMRTGRRKETGDKKTSGAANGAVQWRCKIYIGERDDGICGQSSGSSCPLIVQYLRAWTLYQ